MESYKPQQLILMEETAEYITETSSRTEIQSYLVMLHLVREKVSTFKELANLLGLEQVGNHLPNNVLDGIHRKIASLEAEWDEKIPKINALVFTDKGIATSWVCEMFTKDENKPPTGQQIAELTAEVANYDKWDKVLDAFKPKL